MASFPLPAPSVLQAIRREARQMNSLRDVDPLIELIGDSRLVLMGEATHGTQEFYRVRTELSRRLIAEHGFDAVVAEADWPSALRASRYAQAASTDRSADVALREFILLADVEYQRALIHQADQVLRGDRRERRGAHARLVGEHHDQREHDRAGQQGVVGHVLDESFHESRGVKKGSALYRRPMFSPMFGRVGI